MKKKAVVWAGVVMLVWALAGFGQVTTGTILGEVSDSSGALVPGAKVTIRNVDTGISRTATTDAAGRYRIPQLGPGNYEVTGEAVGFQAMVRRGIELTVGQQVTLNFSLQVGAVAEQVTVVGEAPLIETTTSSIGGLVSQTQMRDLPINVRSFEQLATLQPNVYWLRNVKYGTNTGFTPRISAAGMRTSHNVFYLDGIDIMDTTGQSPGSAAGQLMGMETLREFRVLTNNYSAQYGRALGAVIDVVSRGGTNEIHGTVFEFMRNDKVDARNFFDVAKAPLRRNQFGAVIGGPIVKDRAFFFGSYEALRTRAGNTRVFFFPTEQAKLGILPDPKNPGKTYTIPIHPAMPAYLKYYPTPQEDIGSGVGRYRDIFNSKTREDFVTGRVDYQHSANVAYFTRYTFDDTDLAKPGLPTVIPPWGDGLTSRNQIVSVAETRIINPQLINEFRAGFVRYTPQSRIYLTGPDPQLQFPGTIGAAAWITGSAHIPGAAIAPMGYSATRPFERQFGNTFQFGDSMSYSAGAHFLKAGFNVERFHDNVGSYTPGQGLYENKSTYRFDDMFAVLQGTPRSFGGPQSPTPAGISGRQWLYGMYFQDDYRWLSNFTLNLGLRYEFVSNYSNVNNRFLVLKEDLFGTILTDQKYAYDGRMCTRCVEPRFGFAWDVFSNGKTAVKGGFGMFHSQVVRMAALYPVTASSLGGVNISVDYPSFPNPTIPNSKSRIRIVPTGTPGSIGRMLQRTPKTPTALQWNFTIDQQLTPSTMLRLVYVGSHGYNLDGGYGANTNTYVIRPDGSRYFAPGSHRRRPELGAVSYFPNDFNSYYNGFSVTMGHRMAQGISVEGSYVFSRATDDTSMGGSMPATIQNDATQMDERRNVSHALAGMDMRHRGVFNATYDFPALRAQSGFANKLFSGWQLNSIITLQAGNPLSPINGFDRANALGLFSEQSQRPNLIKGPVPICPCTMPASLGGGTQASPVRYFDPTVFALPEAGTYGNAGRNIVTGPGLVNFDFALVKKTAITERMELQFRAEAFNMFNNVNWGAPSRAVMTTTGAIAPSAGAITNTSTDSRQMQFALKLVF